MRSGIARGLVAAVVAVVLPSVSPAPVSAETGAAVCAGWWEWHWDNPQPGKVTVRSALVHNACAAALSPAPDAAVVATQWVGGRGSFTESYGPSRCAATFNVGPMVITGGTAAAGGWTDANGYVWQMTGAFVGNTCLNSPTGGTFYVHAAKPL